MTPPKAHYQCWTPSDTASDTCAHDERGIDPLCAGCARQYSAVRSTNAQEAVE